MVLITEPIQIKVDCPGCGGTGLYHGFLEPHGVGVPCNQCGGTGGKVVTITPFTERKTRKDIGTVRYRRQNGPDIDITYQQFLNGEIPPKEE